MKGQIQRIYKDSYGNIRMEVIIPRPNVPHIYAEPPESYRRCRPGEGAYEWYHDQVIHYHEALEKYRTQFEEYAELCFIIDSLHVGTCEITQDAPVQQEFLHQISPNLATDIEDALLWDEVQQDDREPEE
jgi:hypothetical protein